MVRTRPLIRDAHFRVIDIGKVYLNRFVLRILLIPSKCILQGDRYSLVMATLTCCTSEEITCGSMKALLHLRHQLDSGASPNRLVAK